MASHQRWPRLQWAHPQRHPCVALMPIDRSSAALLPAGHAVRAHAHRGADGGAASARGPHQQAAQEMQDRLVQQGMPDDWRCGGLGVGPGRWRSMVWPVAWDQHGRASWQLGRFGWGQLLLPRPSHSPLLRSSGVTATTFHSFCYTLIKRHYKASMLRARPPSNCHPARGPPP
jgi:hypothetical protein